MIFSSGTFVFFFAIVFVAYWRLKHRFQNVFLVAASLWFYGSWNPWLVWLIVFSATVDYFCGRGMETDSDRRRRRLVAVSVVTNLGLLGYFKYANFFIESGTEFLTGLGFEVSAPVLNIILPVGISFYTFQSMSYTLDVYRRQVEPCRDYLDFLLYVSFFPQLVAGPIERARAFLPQVLLPRARLSRGDVLVAVKLLVVGYFQKVVIADNLAPIVDFTFSNPDELDGLSLLTGLYAFTFQVYCDFSGYSKIARGVARLLGFRLMTNFYQPYLCTNIAEVWRRWHISLSTWLRDYLYFPLGGSRRGRLRTYYNVMVTMVLCGLWHGASWNYVLFGALHALLLSAYKLATDLRGRPFATSTLGHLASGFLTFQLWSMALIIFRTYTLGDSLIYLQGLAHGPWRMSTEVLEVALFGALSMGLDVALQRRRGHQLSRIFFRHWIPETVMVALLVLAILLVGENDVVPFIYFQF
jgi:alginate O-acetyltransferase complex protein AlgI